ncbi:MAG TPA: Wzz/FepE/Etk N-terminal domain-containing protein [Blastocatellia bacterium]|nr:Wzz/FepE/Etk N-terminal domain-containing protein [Blastocatellia bacterium]
MGSFRPRSIAEILQALWRRKVLILFVTTVIATAALLVIINIPKVYESHSLIVVSGAIYDRNANGAQIAAVTEQLTSRSNLENLVNKYNLYTEVKRTDLRVQNLQSDIKFDTKFRSDSQGFPESFTLGFRHTDAATTQHLVADLVSLFEQANMTLSGQAYEESERIKSELAAIESRLSKSNQERAANAARSSAVSHAAAASDKLRVERTAIASSMEQLRDRQYVLEKQISEQRALIAQQKELVRTSAPAPDDARAGSYGALLKRKADLEAQIQDYSSRFTEKYPKLVAAREQLSEVNRRIADAGSTGEQNRASATSGAAQELRNLERELNRMQTELEVVQREMSRKMQAASMLPGGIVAATSPAVSTPHAIAQPAIVGSDLRDYTSDALRERYTSLLRREDALREFTPSTAGPGTPFFQIVDAPDLPQAPAAPHRTKLMMFALAMAAAGGIVAALLAELPKLTRLHDERDVSYFLGVPVLASIPQSLTISERSAARRRMMTRGAIYFLIGAIAVPLLALLLNASRLFHILGYKQ